MSYMCPVDIITITIQIRDKRLYKHVFLRKTINKKIDTNFIFAVDAISNFRHDSVNDRSNIFNNTSIVARMIW